jgi:hypothetical protein
MTEKDLKSRLNFLLGTAVESGVSYQTIAGHLQVWLTENFELSNQI